MNANVKDPSKFTEEESKLLTCVVRVANRIGVDIMQNNEVGNRWLTTLIFYRLGEIKALNNEAMQKFPMLTFMMYTAAKEALQEIDLLE
jgi:hypothetical protein